MTAGRLLGIARHARPRAPMETLETVTVTLEGGLQGDFRGAVKPGGRGRRQVTVMTIAGWQAALAELGATISWEQRRMNLLIDGIDLMESTGAHLRFAGGVALRVTGECDPCRRMEAVAPGLEAVLLPDWRSGIISRVATGGTLNVGEEVRIEPA